MRAHVLALGCIVAMAGGPAVIAQESWVSSVRTSSQWASFPCTNLLITSVCSTDKDYSDPGSLPSLVSVGDTVAYTDQKARRKKFTVRHISYFVYDNDVDFTYGGQRLTARRGDTSCTLYDVLSRAATDASKYPSKIVIKQCRMIR